MIRGWAAAGVSSWGCITQSQRTGVSEPKGVTSLDARHQHIWQETSKSYQIKNNIAENGRHFSCTINVGDLSTWDIATAQNSILSLSVTGILAEPSLAKLIFRTPWVRVSLCSHLGNFRFHQSLSAAPGSILSWRGFN